MSELSNKISHKYHKIIAVNNEYSYKVDDQDGSHFSSYYQGRLLKTIHLLEPMCSHRKL